MADAAALGLSEDRVTWSDLRGYRARRARSARLIACILLSVAGGAITWVGFLNQEEAGDAVKTSPQVGESIPAGIKTLSVDGKAARTGSLCEALQEWQAYGKFGGVLRRGAGLTGRCKLQQTLRAR